MDTRGLEPRQEQRQSYYLNQKSIIIHSNDRNEKIWPNANNFEVAIPNPYKNVQSIRLANIILPRFSECAFSVNNKNTKFDICYNQTIKTIEIDEGDYTPEQLAIILKNRLNDSYNLQSPELFNVVYNDVSKKLLISKPDQFTLLFKQKPSFDTTYCNQSSRIDIFDKLHNWGLGSFLGFEKKTYHSSVSANDIKLDYLETPSTAVTSSNHYVESPFEVRVNNTENEVFYVEIENLNQFDEVTPDKLMDIVFTNNEVDQHTTSFFSEVVQLQGKGPANSGSGVSHFNPPLDIIKKFKFKFRHHDYSLVDFKNRDFTIILQITYLEPDPFRVGRIRKPEFYEINR